jgi:hypothetical protein
MRSIEYGYGLHKAEEALEKSRKVYSKNKLSRGVLNHHFPDERVYEATPLREALCVLGNMTATTESVHATIWTARHRPESSGVLLRIQDVSGKNLCPDMGYNERCFPWFSSVPQGKC